ncbi:MAG: NAD(P)/FAD-dependent oxidoreductase, partial [Thermoanaerobaculia bacterium]
LCDLSYDIAIVGAGAAGLTAAIFARRTAPDARIVLLDGAKKIGAKILISGGGRCNVTHDVVTPDDFNGNRNAIAKVLRTFTVEQTIAWFAEMGVTLKVEETGKLFPVTDKARTVVDALLRECADVEVRTEWRVERVIPRREDDAESPAGGAHGGPSEGDPAPRRGMTQHSLLNDALSARRLILATGGRSVPKTGSDGFGYSLARSLGHTITDTFPALVPLLVEPGHWIPTLSGTSVDAELSVRSETGRVLVRHRGSMLFTHFGLSGPVVLDISRHWIEAKGSLFANLLPGETFESLDAALVAEGKKALRGRLPERVVDTIWGENPKPTRDERRRIARAFVELPIPVVRDRGFDYAEVTAGGVPLSEIDVSTMASRKCEGLYLCGEILDVDGRIGGYNFQWAWASGRLAGIHAARSLHTA